MRAIFETAEGAIFIRGIERAQPVMAFAINSPGILNLNDYPDNARDKPTYKIRNYRLYDSCQRIALYREVVE